MTKPEGTLCCTRTSTAAGLWVVPGSPAVLLLLLPWTLQQPLTIGDALHLEVCQHGCCGGLAHSWQQPVAAELGQSSCIRPGLRLSQHCVSTEAPACWCPSALRVRMHADDTQRRRVGSRACVPAHGGVERCSCCCPAAGLLVDSPAVASGSALPGIPWGSC